MEQSIDRYAKGELSNLPEILEDHRHPLKPWFGRFRADRREHRRPPGSGSRRAAVVTMVHNEPVMLPIWLRHYSEHFEPEDIYVLDHESDDGSTEGPGFNRIPVGDHEYEPAWHVEVVESMQARLCERYDVVVAVDVDELVMPHPEFGTLREYLDRVDEEFVTCMGYEVMHMPDREPGFDPARPVTAQRGYWFENAAYNKSSVTMAPARWEPGFHRRKDGHARFDPDLFLIHLHRIDYEMCLRRHRDREANLGAVAGTERLIHIRESAGERFDHWFFRETGFEGFPPRVERIPEAWSGAF